MHITMLGSYASYTRHSAQYAWLKQDLATVDRCELLALPPTAPPAAQLAPLGQSLRAQQAQRMCRARTPWLIVGMHAPWYNSNTAHQVHADSASPASSAQREAVGLSCVDSEPG